jgi:hypothetical protein
MTTHGLLGKSMLISQPLCSKAASAHNQPCFVWIRLLTKLKVDSAGIAAWTGLDWFKIAEEGLDTKTGLWGVDSLLAGNGWWNFTMPACIAAGQYLMRVELTGITSLPLLKPLVISQRSLLTPL